MSQQPYARSASSRTWILYLLALCLSILLYGAVFSTNTISSIAFLAGESVVYALATWLVLRVFVLSGRGYAVNATALFAIYVSFVCALLLAATRSEEDALIAWRSIQSSIDRAIVGSLADEQSAPTLPVPSEMAGGDFGELQDTILRHVGAVSEIYSRYAGGLATIGWNSLLDPERLSVDSGLRESRNMVDRASSLLDDYRESTLSQIEVVESEIARLDVHPRTRRLALSGFQESKASSLQLIVEQTRLERMILDKFSSILDLLEGTSWHAEDGYIVFEDAAAADRYNADLAEISSLVVKQQTLREEALRSYAKLTERMNKLIQRRAASSDSSISR